MKIFERIEQDKNEKKNKKLVAGPFSTIQL